MMLMLRRCVQSWENLRRAYLNFAIDTDKSHFKNVRVRSSLRVMSRARNMNTFDTVSSCFIAGELLEAVVGAAVDVVARFQFSCQLMTF